MIILQDPIHPMKWAAVKNCTSEQSTCFQPSFLLKTDEEEIHNGMSEDCLYLNVYSPEVSHCYLTCINVFYCSSISFPEHKSSMGVPVKVYFLPMVLPRNMKSSLPLQQSFPSYDTQAVLPS